MTFSKDEHTADLLEQLEGVESALMDYDTTLTENRNDPALVHIIFRHAHNLKSRLSMAGLTGASSLIHSVEEQFDLIRSGVRSADRDLLDASLTAVDRIRNAVDSGEDSPEDDTLRTNLQKTQSPVSSTFAGIPFELKDEWKNALTSADRKPYVFRIEKAVTTDIDKETYESLPIFDTVREVGSIIAVHPPFEELNRSREEDLLHIIFSTDKTEDDLFFIIFDPLIQLNIEKTVQPAPAAPAAETGQQPAHLRALIVEDDFITRHLEVNMIREYARCEVAVSAPEALEAFKRALEEDDRYGLVILDMMLPEGSGSDVLSGLRSMETDAGIGGLDRSKVVIVSNVKDMETVRGTFRDQADAYLVKPVDREEVRKILKKLGIAR